MSDGDHVINSRSDRLACVGLASRPALNGPEAAALFETPGDAIECLTDELSCIWSRYRSADTNRRRPGTLDLASGGYFQWIGYADRIAVECSSNTYLPRAHRLSSDDEDRLVRWGFSRPTEDLPNFWLDVTSRHGIEDAAFAIVAAMTTVFGVYAG